MSKNLNLHSNDGIVAKHGEGMLIGHGATTPSSGQRGLHPGCLFLNTSTGVLTRNTGSLTSATMSTVALPAAGAAITAASESHALNATFSDTEAETALNALGAAINTIITRLEAAGIVAAN